MQIGPNTALAFSFSGVLGIYLELVRPGRAIAGCLGVALLLWGCYELWLYRLNLSGCLFLLLAAVLFLSEVVFNTRFFSGVAGTAALFAGLRTLLVPPRIHPGLALAVALILGLLTTLLCASARKARRNKWADLPEQS